MSCGLWSSNRFIGIHPIKKANQRPFKIRFFGLILPTVIGLNVPYFAWHFHDTMTCYNIDRSWIAITITNLIWMHTTSDGIQFLYFLHFLYEETSKLLLIVYKQYKKKNGMKTSKMAITNHLWIFPFHLFIQLPLTSTVTGFRGKIHLMLIDPTWMDSSDSTIIEQESKILSFLYRPPLTLQPTHTLLP